MLGATREIYRGFVLDYWRKPVPTSDYDWGWTHVDYDGAPDAFDNRAGYAPTRRAALLCIDEWHEEDFLNREECDEHSWGHGDQCVGCGEYRSLDL